MEYIFVYGTLLKKAKNGLADYLKKNAKLVGNGYFFGELFMISWYPGAILDDKKTSKVYGRIYSMKDPAAMLELFDDYEGIGIKYPEPHEYKREKAIIYYGNNKQIECWVYIYNWPTQTLKRIVGGDFLSTT